MAVREARRASIQEILDVLHIQSGFHQRTGALGLFRPRSGIGNLGGDRIDGLRARQLYGNTPAEWQGSRDRRRQSFRRTVLSRTLRPTDRDLDIHRLDASASDLPRSGAAP